MSLILPVVFVDKKQDLAEIILPETTPVDASLERIVLQALEKSSLATAIGDYKMYATSQNVSEVPEPPTGQKWLLRDVSSNGGLIAVMPSAGSRLLQLEGPSQNELKSGREDADIELLKLQGLEFKSIAEEARNQAEEIRKRSEEHAERTRKELEEIRNEANAARREAVQAQVQAEAASREASQAQMQAEAARREAAQAKMQAEADRSELSEILNAVEVLQQSLIDGLNIGVKTLANIRLKKSSRFVSRVASD
eukprot:CAMPEP_0196653326 /NCGR_PEP_ID=MMETSP1086-20130531/2947_1 /TAXON_ID=77921 /ORGANISM="Cyanoptyche  gloeocystis , Strain SAG4.97" /LENGTH=252 /DNA_ID=CAMNT_0041984463 /DNA_START=6 /DNA_END=764 /DNA_ORIENTATION=+